MSSVINVKTHIFLQKLKGLSANLQIVYKRLILSLLNFLYKKITLHDFITYLLYKLYTYITHKMYIYI